MTTTIVARPVDAEYGYEVLLADNFDGVLGRTGRPTDLEALVDLALRRGRVLLQAPGGAGKTWTIERIRRIGEGRGLRPTLVSVADLAPDGAWTWSLDALLAAGEPAAEMGDLADGAPMLILIDGLNEAGREIADSILRRIDELARHNPAAGAVVTDRLSRRSVDTSRWRLATLGEVGRERVESLMGQPVTDGEAGLLASPVYLEYALKSRGRSSTTGSESHRRYLEEQLGLDPAVVDGLAEQALDDYSHHSGRAFPIAPLVRRLGQETTNRLVVDGALNVVDQLDTNQQDDAGGIVVRYRHHLIHDYLAARAASGHPEKWNSQLFEALTFRASSNEALQMLLEQSAENRRDELVRKVYDWNLYSAAYLLAEDRSGPGMVASATEYAVLSLLGERRFDRFLATAEQVSDALRIHGGDYSKHLLEAGDASAVVRIAKDQLRSNAQYQRWVELFAPRDETPAPPWLLDDMSDPDGVRGWTATNVARRVGLDRAGLEHTVDLSRRADAVVRWRAAHVLGVASGVAALERLFELLLRDPERTVRYGALRSIVEHALYEQPRTRRTAIFRQLAETLPEWRSWPRLVDEFARILQVSAPPEGWASSASVVIEQLLIAADGEAERERWRLVSSDLRLRWAREPE